MNRSYRMICVTLLLYIVDKPESLRAQVRLYARKKEDEKLQQTVYVKYKLEGVSYLLDVKNFEFNKVITNKPFCNVR